MLHSLYLAVFTFFRDLWIVYFDNSLEKKVNYMYSSVQVVHKRTDGLPELPKHRYRIPLLNDGRVGVIASHKFKPEKINQLFFNQYEFLEWCSRNYHTEVFLHVPYDLNDSSKLKLKFEHLLTSQISSIRYFDLIYLNRLTLVLNKVEDLLPYVNFFSQIKHLSLMISKNHHSEKKQIVKSLNDHKILSYFNNLRTLELIGLQGFNYEQAYKVKHLILRSVNEHFRTSSLSNLTKLTIHSTEREANTVVIDSKIDDLVMINDVSHVVYSVKVPPKRIITGNSSLSDHHGHYSVQIYSA